VVETYIDEGVLREHAKAPHSSQQLAHSSPAIYTRQSELEEALYDHNPGWSEQKTIPNHFENEKYLSSEMFPVFKHMRQETLRDLPSKSDRAAAADALQSPRSPSMHQLALPDMHYERSMKKEAYFQHLDQAFSKITHSPPTNGQGTRPFSLQGLPRVGASTCGSRCRCRCHSNRSVAHLSLSAFTNTLGAFSFSFTGPNSGASSCTDSSCRARRARWLRITYVFPSWLFSAAVTASFSDGIGSPELLIRVSRVLSTKAPEGYYNIFGCT
jgi:hypothetical protein